MASTPRPSGSNRYPGAPAPKADPSAGKPLWTIARQGKVVVVTLKTEVLTGQDDVEALSAAIYEAVKGSTPRVVLGMAGVTAISSRLLGEIAAMNTRFKFHEGALLLAGVTSEVREVFIVTRLDKTITIHDNMDRAVAAFK